jgi:GH25 family lysozyme M1 (1,4-beta-N-acetylmuramidase)
MPEGVYGIDISSHQGDMDVARAAREGFSFVWIKATEGVGYTNPRFAPEMAETLGLGLLGGAYHWLTAGDGCAQARYFLDEVRKVVEPALIAIICDNETNASYQTTKDFFAELRRQLGNRPLYMYTGAWWWNARGWNVNGISDPAPLLWDSEYVNGQGYASVLYSAVPDHYWEPYGGFAETSVLQFSSHGLVAGQVLDVNMFRGTIDELREISLGGDMALSDVDVWRISQQTTRDILGLIAGLRSNPGAADAKTSAGYVAATYWKNDEWAMTALDKLVLLALAGPMRISDDQVVLMAEHIADRLQAGGTTLTEDTIKSALAEVLNGAKISVGS